MQAFWVAHGNATTRIKQVPIYYGHPDTGYRISHRGKRSRRGERIGRRPDVRPALPTPHFLADVDFDLDQHTVLTDDRAREDLCQHVASGFDAIWPPVVAGRIVA